MRNQGNQYKLNPAEINFMPNPQYLIDRMENVDDLAESTDVNLGMRTIEELHETTTSDNEEDPIIDRKEELIMKSGNFKFLSLNERKKFICAKCEEKAVVQRVTTGEDFCYRHCMRRVLRKVDLLTDSEISKKEHLESFKIKVEETKTDLEKAKSVLNNSRISSQEVNTQNLHNVNLLFKHLFEETKHLYSCFLDQIGKKISECETIHVESTELMQYLESELKIIDDDIDRNYDDIILNMEFEPFKAIMTSYNGKVKENLRGISKLKKDLKKVSISKIEIKEKYFTKELKIGKVLGNDLFDIVNKILREDGEPMTEETVLTTDREMLINTTDRSKRLNESSKKKEMDEFMLIKKINTKNLRKEAEKIIVDLNNVIDQLEGQKLNIAPKTPTMKSNKSRLSYLAGKKGITSTKKNKLWNKSKSRNSSLGSRKKTKSDKKIRTSKHSPFKNSNSRTKLSSIFSNRVASGHPGLLNRKLSDVARLEAILKKNSRREKYGYNRPIADASRTNYTALFDIFRQRSSSGSNKSKNSRGYFQDNRGLFEYFRFPQNQRNSHKQHLHLLKGKTSSQFLKSTNRYFQNRLNKADLYDRQTNKILFGGSPDKSTSRNMRDTRYSNQSYGASRKMSYGGKAMKETQTRKFLKEMIKDIEKGRKNPFFLDERKGSADVINALKIGGKKYGFIGKNKHLPNWDLFKKTSKRG